jgi:hypothetical protein
MSQTFKIIVQVTDNSLELLRYINKNLDDINRLGARVRIEKISKKEFDEDMVELLRRENITRLPALVAPDKTIFIGLKRIVDFFERNLNTAKNQDRVSAVGSGVSEMGANPDLSDYWSRQLYDGVSKQDGRTVIRDEDSDEQNETKDIERRLNDYNKKVPKHRQQGGNRELNIDHMDRRRKRTPIQDEPMDNVIDSEDEGYDEPEPITRRDRPRQRISGEQGEDMDDRMMNAWLDNNPGGD